MNSFKAVVLSAIIAAPLVSAAGTCFNLHVSVLGNSTDTNQLQSQFVVSALEGGEYCNSGELRKGVTNPFDCIAEGGNVKWAFDPSALTVNAEYCWTGDSGACASGTLKQADKLENSMQFQCTEDPVHCWGSGSICTTEPVQR